MGQLFEIGLHKEREDAPMVGEDVEETAMRKEIIIAFSQKELELDAADKAASAKTKADLNQRIPNTWLNRTRWARHQSHNVPLKWQQSPQLPPQRRSSALRPQYPPIEYSEGEPK